MFPTLSLPVSESVITSPPFYTLSFVYIQLCVEFITISTLAWTASAGLIDGRYGERWEFASFLRVSTCVSERMRMCVGLACVCWPWRYTMGHLYRPSAPTKLPLGVGVLTMFWTISSNKSQPKLLVSVSLAKWQTVHPPKSLLLPNRQKGRGRQTEGQRNTFLRADLFYCFVNLLCIKNIFKSYSLSSDTLLCLTVLLARLPLASNTVAFVLHQQQ